MSENESDLPPAVDLGKEADESPEESVATQADAVAGEPGWDAVEGEDES